MATAGCAIAMSLPSIQTARQCLLITRKLLMTKDAKITGSKVQVFTVPTDAPESDGTYAWDSTTMVLVSIQSGSCTGLGYTYADAATGKLVQTLLEKVVSERDAFDHG